MSACTETASALPSADPDGECTAGTDTPSSTRGASDAIPTSAAVTTDACPHAGGDAPADAVTNKCCAVTLENEKEVMPVICISSFVLVFFFFFLLKLQISLLLLLLLYYNIIVLSLILLFLLLMLLLLSSLSSS